MAISDTLSSIITNLSNAYYQIGTMGGTIPLSKNMENLPSAIGTIPQSGGGSDSRFKAYAEGTLTSINDSTITLLKDWAFASSPALQTVYLPNCSYLGVRAFASCRELSSVVIGDNSTVFQYASNTFNNCYNLSLFNNSSVVNVDKFNYYSEAFYSTSINLLVPSVLSNITYFSATSSTNYQKLNWENSSQITYYGIKTDVNGTSSILQLRPAASQLNEISFINCDFNGWTAGW